MDTCNKIKKQLFLYACVGVWNTIFGYILIFFCMYALHMHPVISNVIGYSIAILVSFVLNRTLVFRSENKNFIEFVKFIGVFFIAFGINLVFLHILIDQLAVHAAVSQVISGIVYTVVSFILNKTIVFSSLFTKP